MYAGAKNEVTFAGLNMTNTNTIRLHRVLRATPERIYRAFLDADAMAKWLPPNGFTGKVHRLEAKVGGTYKMSFTNFSTGKSHSFGGRWTRQFRNTNCIRHRQSKLEGKGLRRTYDKSGGIACNVEK